MEGERGRREAGERAEEGRRGGAVALETRSGGTHAEEAPARRAVGGEHPEAAAAHDSEGGGEALRAGSCQAPRASSRTACNSAASEMEAEGRTRRKHQRGGPLTRQSRRLALAEIVGLSGGHGRRRRAQQELGEAAVGRRGRSLLRNDLQVAEPAEGEA